MANSSRFMPESCEGNYPGKSARVPPYRGVAMAQRVTEHP